VINGVEWAGKRVDQVTLAQSQMQPVTRKFGTSLSYQGSITLDSLFPFANGSPGGPYRIYAGGCAGADPTQQTPPETNLRSLPDLSAGSALAGGYRLQIPAFDFKVTVNGTSDPNAKTEIVATTPGCDNPNPASVSPTGVVAGGADTGRPAAPGFPYGTYNVCAEAKVSGATRHETVVGAALNALPSVRLTAGSGAAAGTINVTGSSPSGGC
jgi:hypothetical protein